ncbi:hypothetical protein [Pontibacter ummariensis]|nr:hypothetical protein [Pontibacter ummariensis]
MKDFNQQVREYKDIQEQSKDHIKQASENVSDLVATTIRVYRGQMPKEVESVILDLAMYYQDGATAHCSYLERSNNLMDDLFKRVEELAKINQQHVQYSIQLAKVLKEAGFDIGPIPGEEKEE